MGSIPTPGTTKETPILVGVFFCRYVVWESNGTPPPRVVFCYLTKGLCVAGSMNTILFRSFLTCLISCASVVLAMIWVQPETPPEYVPQIAVTLFIIGLASFLLWFTRVFRDMHRIMQEKKY